MAGVNCLVACGRIPRLAAGLHSGPKPLAKQLGAHWPKPLAEPKWMRKVAFLDCCGPLWTAVDCCGLLCYSFLLSSFCHDASGQLRPRSAPGRREPLDLWRLPNSGLWPNSCFRILWRELPRGVNCLVACGRMPASEFCGDGCRFLANAEL